jgi:DNA-directed RNA polymerase specialized sigma24 family protein
VWFHVDVPPEVLNARPHDRIVIDKVKRDLDRERGIARLGASQQKAVHPYYFAGLSVAECAMALNRAESNGKALLYAARERLAAMWSEQ